MDWLQDVGPLGSFQQFCRFPCFWLETQATLWGTWRLYHKWLSKSYHSPICEFTVWPITNDSDLTVLRGMHSDIIEEESVFRISTNQNNGNMHWNECPDDCQMEIYCILGDALRYQWELMYISMISSSQNGARSGSGHFNRWYLFEYWSDRGV